MWDYKSWKVTILLKPCPHEAGAMEFCTSVIIWVICHRSDVPCPLCHKSHLKSHQLLCKQAFMVNITRVNSPIICTQIKWIAIVTKWAEIKIIQPQRITLGIYMLREGGGVQQRLTYCTTWCLAPRWCMSLVELWWLHCNPQGSSADSHPATSARQYLILKHGLYLRHPQWHLHGCSDLHYILYNPCHHLDLGWAQGHRYIC